MELKKLFLAMAFCAGAMSVSADAASPSFAEFNRKAEHGDRLTVAFLGGSLTWGARASDPQKTSYRALIGQKLEAKYPKAHFKFIDAAVGGTGSQLGVFRLQRDVLAYKPDLVFLDFTLNDGAYDITGPTLAAYESLVRRIVTEGKCPVVVMFLAARSMVTDGTTAKMKRYQEHMKIAKAYNTGVGDAISHMQAKLKAGKLELDVVWPPEFFDTCHPNDPGYALYAEAGWNGYLKAVKDKTVCAAPEKMLFGNGYMNWKRVRLSSLDQLPKGWKTTLVGRDYCAFDFLMSRWLDDVTVASNYTAETRKDTKPSAVAAEPLKLRFHGSSVLLFGVATPRSCKYKVTIDGKAHEYNAKIFGNEGVGRMWVSVEDDLDPNKEHSLEITPVFVTPWKAQELCLESICIAGPGKVSLGY